MSHFIVSARKYRPDTFASVVGQNHITATLKNAIKTNHLAQAFLFCGPRGVGKTTNARILAKTINCTQLLPEIEPCNQCSSCVSFNSGGSVNIFELDAASNNSVDDIRSLVEQVRYPPQAGKFKIYIIDEVHMLSNAAFNAFLKTLEEPPSYAIFILATTERQKILPTILSRCQIFDFNRIKPEDSAKHLEYICQQEHIDYEYDGLYVIAQKADGALRDALSMLDQIGTFSGGNISYQAVIDNLNVLDYTYYFRATDYFLEQNIGESLLLLDDILMKGFDGSNFLLGLMSHFRNLLVSKEPKTLRLLEVTDKVKKQYLEQANAASTAFLISGLSVLSACELQYKSSRNQRNHLELALLRLANLNAVFRAKDDDRTETEPTDKKKNEPQRPQLTQQTPSTAIETQEPTPVWVAQKNTGSAPDSRYPAASLKITNLSDAAHQAKQKQTDWDKQQQNPVEQTTKPTDQTPKQTNPYTFLEHFEKLSIQNPYLTTFTTEFGLQF